MIHAHRSPLETIPSGANLNFTLWRMYADDPDPAEVGRQWIERMAWATRRGMAARDGMPDAGRRFSDVWYRDALSDPIAQVERIYGAIGLELIPEARAAMEGWLARNARDRHPSYIRLLGRTSSASPTSRFARREVPPGTRPLSACSTNPARRSHEIPSDRDGRAARARTESARADPAPRRRRRPSRASARTGSRRRRRAPPCAPASMRPSRR